VWEKSRSIGPNFWEERLRKEGLERGEHIGGVALKKMEITRGGMKQPRMRKGGTRLLRRTWTFVKRSGQGERGENSGAGSESKGKDFLDIEPKEIWGTKGKFICNRINTKKGASQGAQVNHWKRDGIRERGRKAHDLSGKEMGGGLGGGRW